MAPVKVPPNLPELVRTAFNKARASGDVNFYPTQVTILNVNSIPVGFRTVSACLSMLRGMAFEISSQANVFFLVCVCLYSSNSDSPLP